MKNKLLIFIGLILSVIVSFTSCDDQSVEKKNGNDQEVMFEVNYINTAWRKQFKGFIIDKNGLIKTYDKPVKWNKTDGKTGLTASQMQENLSYTALSNINISNEDLKNSTSIIPSLSDSAYTKPVNGGADRGITSFYAYRYDADKLIYTPVLLRETGDWETYNKDPSAIKISTWLTEILNHLY